MKPLRSLPWLIAQMAILTLAVWIGWAGSWLAFGERSYLHLPLVPSAVLGAVICSLYRLRIRRRPSPQPSFPRLALLSAFGVYAALSTLHFLPKPATRFEFLGTHPIAMRIEPSWPELVGAAYSFPGEPQSLMGRAASELSASGYAVTQKKRTLSADRKVGSDQVTEVYIETGKLKGKHWLVDGDMLDLEDRTDWVTVTVIEPDNLPLWLRSALP